MAAKDEPYHYNHHRLDVFLQKDYDPKEIGNHLDQIRDRLVELVHHQEDYRQTIKEDHYLLGELRDIFWSIKKSEHGDS